MNPDDFTAGLVIDEASLLAACPPYRTAAKPDLPLRIDNRWMLPESSNQGSTPQCAAYSMAGLIEFRGWKENGTKRQIDPEPIYAEAKKIDGNSDPGTRLESVVIAAGRLGHILTPGTFMTCRTSDEVCRALHQYGAVIAGFSVDESWCTPAEGGWISGGGRKLGGHAVLLCAYSLDGSDEWIGFQNSWGSGLGWRGFGRLPWSLFEKQHLYSLVWT